MGRRNVLSFISGVLFASLLGLAPIDRQIATAQLVLPGQNNLAPGEQFESTVKNATSGLYILKNAEQDYSVKILSGDGTKNVTIIRYEGATAEADAQLVFTLFRSVLLVLRLDV